MSHSGSAVCPLMHAPTIDENEAAALAWWQCHPTSQSLVNGCSFWSVAHAHNATNCHQHNLLSSALLQPLPNSANDGNSRRCSWRHGQGCSPRSKHCGMIGTVKSLTDAQKSAWVRLPGCAKPKLFCTASLTPFAVAREVDQREDVQEIVSLLKQTIKILKEEETTDSNEED